MLAETDREELRQAGQQAAHQVRARQNTDHGMAILGGGGSIPSWPASEGPSMAGAAARVTGSRLSMATKAALYEHLKRKRRTWLRVLLFGPGKPAGVTSPARRTTARGGITLLVTEGWTPAKRTAAGKKAIRRRRRRANGRLV